MKRLISTLAVAALALAAGAFGPGARQVVAAATAPPPPPAPSKVAPTVPPAGLPAAASSPGVSIPLSPNSKASPSAPPDDNRKGLDGVWEVAVQTTDGETSYVHFKIAQKGSTLTGIFLDNQHNNKKYPAAGSVDGKNFHLVVTKDDGSIITMEALVDGTTDMVGMMKQGSNQVAFTAAYRAKYKLLDNISPGLPGGIGGGSGGGAGGYPGGPPKN
ncbi:MAG: hypothetical protein M3126_04655 [Candidatus Eremiobacteraeota bacterium]|nr:hypothetical protein [Candidatus Eremiobacteraeota bacterium]